MLKICEVCGKEYEGKSFSKYCSPKCKKKKNNATFQKKRSEKRKQDWEQLEHIKQCPVCGKEFELKQTHRTQKYCCAECRRKAERLYGHKRETDLAYKDKIRFDGNRTKALERDEYTCTMCGAKKDLVVHHIDCSGQTDEPNNDVDNLTTLCRRCHINLHKLIDKQNK